MVKKIQFPYRQTIVVILIALLVFSTWQFINASVLEFIMNLFGLTEPSHAYAVIAIVTLIILLVLGVSSKEIRKKVLRLR